MMRTTEEGVGCPICLFSRGGLQCQRKVIVRPEIATLRANEKKRGYWQMGNDSNDRKTAATTTTATTATTGKS